MGVIVALLFFGLIGMHSMPMASIDNAQMPCCEQSLSSVMSICIPLPAPQQPDGSAPDSPSEIVGHRWAETTLPSKNYYFEPATPSLDELSISRT